MYSTTLKKFSGRLNASSSGTVNQSDDVAGANAVFYAERDAAHNLGYYNKVKCSENDVSDSTVLVNQELYIGALHSAADNALNPSNEYIRTIVLCKNLGATKQALLYDIIKYFNDNVAATF
jgi:hypothetical protein